MRSALALALFIPGLLLVASPGMLLGVAMMVGGWWIYERSGIPDGDGLEIVLALAGGLGATVVTIQAAADAIGRLP